MARPTDYTPELLEKAKGYVASVLTDDNDQELLPTIEGLSLYLDVARSTIYLWAKSNAEFSDILDAIMARQGSILINGGLANKFNPTITKLMLTKHGYVDKQDVTSDGKALPTPILGSLPKDDA